ncbi:MAG TPA: BTAD domain-containing putative transcriptional regulator [Chloroflexota bacterium]|nr:BTAD domain-containing putative transcriptional regulator [Chloroflexota bacterium]
MPRPSRAYAGRIQPPLPPGDYVDRPRLRDLLDAAVPRGVAMLVAPGGFGKTVALADFARQASFPCAWLTLTAADGDLASFADAVVAALRRVLSGCGEGVAGAARHGGDAAIGLVADELAVELSGRAGPVGLVLDDFHAVDFTRDVARTVAALLDRAPPAFFLAIGSRTLPALPHARLLASGRLVGITAEDLRFTQDEVAAYLGTTPESDPARRLFDRIIGWPAALHLVSGMASHPALDDYLESEVLLQQRSPVRDFLLKASVPPVLTEALCADVLDEPLGGEYLAEAHAAGLFVAALPDGGWRIHDLFRDFLRARLRRTDPALWVELHRRTADDLAFGAHPADAVALLLEAGLHDEAGQAIQTHADRLVNEGRWGSLRAWLEKLPNRVLRTRPRLLTLQARALSFDVDPTHVLNLLDAAVEGCLAADDTVGAAEALAFRANRLVPSGRRAEAADDLRRVRQLLASRDHRVMATVLRLEAIDAAAGRDFDRAVALMAEGLARAQRHRDRTEQASCERGLGWIRGLAGDVGGAAAHYERAVHLLEEIGDLRAAAETRVSLGYTYHEQGSPNLARRTFEEAFARADRAGFARVKAYALENLAVLDREAGAVDRAVDRLNAVLELARKVDDSRLIALALDHLAQCHRIGGGAATAEVLARQALTEAERGYAATAAEAARATLAAALLDQGLATEAFAAVRPVVDRASQASSSATLVRARLVAALSGRATGDPTWPEELRAAAEMLPRLKNRGFLRAEVAGLGPSLRALADLPEVADAVRAILAAGEEAPTSAPLSPRAAGSLRLSRVEARLFGKPIVLLAGPDGPAPPSDPAGHWRLAPTRELFYLLEAYRGGLTADQIVDRLWPDAPPGRGHQLFWHYSHRLRAVLGHEALVKREARWQLNQQLELDSDVARFEAAVDRLRASAPGSPEEAEALAAAQAAYGGAYLEDVQARWVERERTTLEAKHRGVLKRLAERQLAAGEAAAAVRTGQELLRAAPLSEEACRLLLRALIATGRRVYARQIYHRFARRVEKQLGAPPARSIKTFLAAV